MELSSNESMFIRALLMPCVNLHVVANHLDRDFLWGEVLHIQQHRKIPRVLGHLCCGQCHTGGTQVVGGDRSRAQRSQLGLKQPFPETLVKEASRSGKTR